MTLVHCFEQSYPCVLIESNFTYLYHAHLFAFQHHNDDPKPLNITHLRGQFQKEWSLLTLLLLEILYGKRGSSLTFQDLLLELRKSLFANSMDQIPQLTSSRRLVELKKNAFSLVGEY